MSGNEKFSDPIITSKGEQRAFAPFNGLETLWFNTGTLCNLECQNCYIESSPKNDSLSYISVEDIIPYLNEIERDKLSVQTIGLTGGEPFINPQIIAILKEILSRGLKVTVLSNAYKVLKRHSEALLKLKDQYDKMLTLRISLDHYSENLHDKERGQGTFKGTFESLQWLFKHRFHFSIAGRSLTGEAQEEAIAGYQRALLEHEIHLKLTPQNIVIFPEMDDKKDVPEITTSCWDILGKSVEQLMCTKERMIVKKKDRAYPQVQACTLLSHQEEFNLGSSLSESEQNVYLNHPFCSQFCVLGNASCSSTS